MVEYLSGIGRTTTVVRVSCGSPLRFSRLRLFREVVSTTVVTPLVDDYYFRLLPDTLLFGVVPGVFSRTPPLLSGLKVCIDRYGPVPSGPRDLPTPVVVRL